MSTVAEKPPRLAGIPRADGFHARGKEHIRMLRGFRERGKEWGSSYENRSGDYTGRRFFAGDEFVSRNEWDIPLRRSETELVGLEKYFERMVLKLLEMKNGMDTPVVMLDIGGFMGQTWMRIGKRFEEEIRNSKLVLLVSNLAYNPEEHFEQELNPGRIGHSKAQAIKDLDRSARELVLYHVGNSRTLRRTEIGTYDDKRFPLQGNTDFIFENFSLHYWSWVPELEILEAASLLSPIGTYLTSGGDYKVGSYGYEHNEQRMAGIDIAHDEIKTRFNLLRVEQAEEGSLKGARLGYDYWYFKKPTAPKYEVNWGPISDLEKSWCAGLNGLSSGFNVLY